MTLSLLRRLLRNPSLRAIAANAGSLVGTAAVTSGLGVIFWWLAARFFSTNAVGFASAAISSMTLIGTLSMLGFGTLLMGELPRRKGEEAMLISSALAVSATVAALLGVCFALLAPRAVPGLAPLRATPFDVLLYAAGVALTAATLVLDQALIGLLRGDVQLVRNGLFALVKLVAVGVVGLALSAHTGMSIYATWALGNLVSVLLLGAYALRSLGQPRSALPRWRAVRGLGREALSHHVLNLSLQGPTLALPVIVTAVVSVSANAAFYIAWMVAGIVFVGPLALSIVLYAADAADPKALEHKVRFTTSLALAIGVGSNLFILVAGGYILRIFGASYAAQGRICLTLLGLAVFPLIVKDHYTALSRIDNRVLPAATLTLAGGAVELVAAVIGAWQGGLAGLCLGWDLALVGEALVMGSTVYNALFPRLHVDVVGCVADELAEGFVLIPRRPPLVRGGGASPLEVPYAERQ